MKITDELTANNILNKINGIIFDDNLSDIEALKKIVLILKENNITIESVIGEQKKN